MGKPKSAAFAHIRAEVLRLVATVPEGKFTTYGSIAKHMNVMARHVAFIISRLTSEEAKSIPWHRVLGAEARISPNMPENLAQEQRSRLQAEGFVLNKAGYIQKDEDHFYPMGSRRNIRWSDSPEGRA